MEAILILFNLIVSGILTLTLGYFGFYAWGVRRDVQSKHFPTSIPTDNHLVLIPAYKEDAVIVDTVRQALAQDYTGDYEVVVLADSLQQNTLDALSDLPCTVLPIVLEARTKAKALSYALHYLPADYSTVVILDADNWMHPDFLTEVSEYFWHGYRVVQGCRQAKNSETSVAVWDGFSEAWNNQIFGRGHQGWGMPPRLIGSGMAFSYVLFERLIHGMDAVGGFDKALELELARENIAIAYNPAAIVYDEKVSALSTFRNQRRRWTSAQFHYLRRHLVPAVRHAIRRGNVAYLNKTMQMMLPPKLSIPVSLALLMSINLAEQNWAWVGVGAVLTTLLVGILHVTMPEGYTWQRLLARGGAFIRMSWTACSNLFRLAGANKKFIHTPHQTV